MTATPEYTTPLLQDAVDVPLWLEADRETAYDTRCVRDRDIASRIDATDDVARVRAWWRHVAQGEVPREGRRVVGARAAGTLIMLAAGLVGGALVAGAAFQYDGTHPVNVVRLLALLVVPQIMLIALTLLMMLPRAPGLRALQEALAVLNPGALAAAAFRRLSGREAPSIARLTGSRFGANRFAKWQLLHWSQTAAVAFNTAALAVAVALITFTDLAFGWSTTLSTDVSTMHRVVEVLSWPWQHVVPAAVPDAALIDRSQFFRLQGGESLPSGATSRELGGWWAFAVLSILTYGLLPRIALALFTGWRLRTATADLLIDDPRVSALLDRMSAPQVETAATDDEEPLGHPPATAPAPPAGSTAGGPARAIVWSHALDVAAARAEAARRFGLELGTVAEAGGGRELDEDRRAIADVAAGQGTLLIFTPAWEPPLLEFLDFLGALREQIGSTPSIIVAPVAERADVAIGDIERETWARAVGRIADPRLYVETGAAA